MSTSPSTNQLPPDYDDSQRLGEFRRHRQRGSLTPTQTELYAAEAATALIAQFDQNGEYLADATALLAEIASLDDPELAEPARKATFPILVEQMSDSFDPKRCDLYDRIFAQMITYCRHLPSAGALDAALTRYGIKTEFDLLRRRHVLRNEPPEIEREAHSKIRKVLVLSRVTLGADVAITSIVIEKAKRCFPNAEIVFLGSPKLQQLFGGNSSVRIRRVHYRSDGGLIERLLSSLTVIEAVESETSEMSPGEWLVIDPDSRLLQLGLLPATSEDALYFYLESRRYGALGDGSLSFITSRWLNELLEGDEAIHPSLHLRPQDLAFAKSLCEKLRKRSQFLVTVSFGVGGNNLKRMPDPFEAQLITRLIEDGCTVILDKGFGEEEAERARRIVAMVRDSGRTVVELSAEGVEALERFDELRCHLLTWEGEIGPFAALIGKSDEYVGYDSACQHIAAALGVPAIDIFAQAVSAVFQERWKPTGKSLVYIVSPRTNADNRTKSDPEIESVLAEVLSHHKSIKSKVETK